MYMCAQMRRSALCVLLASGLAVGCDATQRGRDAAAPLSQRAAEVSIRIDAPSGGAPQVSVLAFRAAVSGGPLAVDVLGLVDPLVAAAPESRCELREVTAPARALRAQGGAVELEALPNVQLEVVPGGLVLRPAPRVFPQLAAVVGGVIGEAGPHDVSSLPSHLALYLDAEPREPVALPGLPRLFDSMGAPLTGDSRLAPDGDLVLTLVGPPRSFLEVRPFGGTVSLACPAGPGGQVVVPREHLDRLAATSGRVPVSFEAVWRESLLVGAAGQPTRLSVEARSSAVLDLRP